jgi:hypothetical protein
LTPTPAVGSARGANYAYRLCGLKLVSYIDLPALPKWDGPADAPADAVCRLGEVPLRLDRPDHIAPIFQTSGAGEYLLVLPGTGRVLVRNGNEIIVQPDAGASANLSAILTGPILAVLWHQRGLLPLHASVVVINGRTVALCGPAAAGKSTLAAILAAQGHLVVADDIGVVDVRNNQEVLVPPGCARLQLWRDALAELDVATDGLERALQHKERYFLDCGNGIAARRPHQLAAVVQIIRNMLPPAALERLHGSQAADVLYNCVHSPQPAKALGRVQPIFAALMGMASAGVGVWRLRVPEGLAGLREAAAKLPAALEG